MPITLTHPTDSTITWVSGNRGKRPNWVKAILEADSTLLPSTKEEKTFVSTVDDTPRLRYWHWNGLNDADGRGIPLTFCIVGAMTQKDAVDSLNKTMTTPVMPAEWAVCWREISPSSVDLGGKLGVFVLNKITKEWEERQVKIGFKA